MNIKWHYILMIIALYSCQNEIFENSNGKETINLSKYINAASRASSSYIDSTRLEDGSHLGVFAFFTQENNYTDALSSPNLMFNQKVSVNDIGGGIQELSYSPLRYWSSDLTHKYSFVAYYPYTKISTSGLEINNSYTTSSTGLPHYHFTVKSEANQQVDFMYSDLLKDVNRNSNGGIAPLTFHHALTQINFSANMGSDVDTANTSIIIDEIKISGLKNKGTLTYGVEGATPSWSNHRTDGTTPIYTCTPNTALRKDSVVLLTHRALDKFLLLPQSHSNTTLEMKFRVITLDDSLASGNITITNTFSTTITDEWLMNQGILYNFEIGLNSVKFNGTTTEWIDAPKYDIAYIGDTYEIYTAEGLRALACLVNGTSSPEGLKTNGVDDNVKDKFKFDPKSKIKNINIKLMNDIDLGSISSWTPIGNGTNFVGIFDGNGKTISNLTINTNKNAQGLFGQINRAARRSTIKNVRIVNANINITDKDKSGHGIIAGTAYAAHFIGCYSSGKINGGTFVGGIVGDVGDVDIIACYSDADVSGKTGASWEIGIGGIVGDASGINMYGCYSTGNNTTVEDYVGGIAGKAEGSNISHCYYTGQAEKVIANSSNPTNTAKVTSIDASTIANMNTAINNWNTNNASDDPDCEYRYDTNGELQ